MATTLSKAEPMSRPLVRTSWESTVTQSTVNRADGISGTQDNKPHSGHDEQTLDKCFKKINGKTLQQVLVEIKR